MSVGIVPLANSALAGAGTSGGGLGGTPGPSSVTDDLLRVLGSIHTNRGDLSTVRYCTTRRFQPGGLAGTQIPAIGVWEEEIEETFMAGFKRDCAMTLRLFCVVQGADEDRARELRDYLRRDINFRLYADQQRSGFAYVSDGENEWTLSTLEDKSTFLMERTVVIRFRESTTGYVFPR